MRLVGRDPPRKVGFSRPAPSVAVASWLRSFKFSRIRLRHDVTDAQLHRGELAGGLKSTL